MRRPRRSRWIRYACRRWRVIAQRGGWLLIEREPEGGYTVERWIPAARF